jgi:hypothetical protein
LCLFEFCRRVIVQWRTVLDEFSIPLVAGMLMVLL